MAKEGINIPVGIDASGLVAGMKGVVDELQKIPTKTKPAKTAIDELNQSYRNTIKDAKNIALALGEDSAAFQDASQKAAALKAKIDGVNESIFKASGIEPQMLTRTTGGFNTLGNSINQVARELPAFTYSMQTGFMAISNNIPMLVDEINRLKIANREMIASGQQAPSVFASLTKALFSWQTGMSLGITVLTVFGAKIAEATMDLFDNQEAIEATQKRIDKLTITAANNAATMELWLDIYSKTLTGVSADLFQARENKEKRFQAIVKQTQDILAEEARTGQKNLIGRNMVYFALMENVKAYNKELKEVAENQKKTDSTATPIKTKLPFEIKTAPIKTDDVEKNFRSALSDIIQNSTKEGWVNINAANLKGMGQFKADFKGLTSYVDEEGQRLKEAFTMFGLQAGMVFSENLGRALVGAESSFDDLYSFFAQLASETANIMFMLGTAASFAPGAQGIAWGYFAAGAAFKLVAGMLGGASANKQAASSGNRSNNTNTDYTGGGYMGGGYQPDPIQVGGIVRGSDLQIVLINTNNQTRRVR